MTGTTEQLRAEIFRLTEELARTKEDLVLATAMAREEGLNAARRGTHELFVDECEPLAGLEGDKPFCRFRLFSDRGDESVGISGREYWVLCEDQSGTELADLQERAQSTAQPA